MSTVANGGDFQFTIRENVGNNTYRDTLYVPKVTMSAPNNENNEKTCVVVIGDFGNRIASDQIGARWPVRLEIIEDDTPMMFVGPVSADVEAVETGMLCIHTYIDIHICIYIPIDQSLLTIDQSLL